MFNHDRSYRLHAFTTAKGTFTLTGTSHDWIDTFKNLDTGEFHEYPRRSIKKWFEHGKIFPVEEATTLIWRETNGNGTTIDYNTKTIHTRRKK